jgi:hypothetical protein
MGIPMSCNDVECDHCPLRDFCAITSLRLGFCFATLDDARSPFDHLPRS